MHPMWMIRAGKNASYIDDFLDKDIVAIGWSELNNFSVPVDKETLKQLITDTYPNDSINKIRMDISQIYRFIHDIKENDYVVSYDPGNRIYYLGKITSAYHYDPSLLTSELPRYRTVKWFENSIDRDMLSETAKNTLGAISTLFKIKTAVAEEILALSKKQGIPISQHKESHLESSEFLSTNDILEQSKEHIKDHIVKMSWDDLQELVAGLLRAMGYKAKVSPKGADRGVDVCASPDGLGLTQPRIFVECKHRKERANANMIRSFLGGRHETDKCLFVSTQGFTKDAQYEAERSKIPLTLLNLSDLVDMIFIYYENFSTEARLLLPLSRIYWLDQ